MNRKYVLASALASLLWATFSVQAATIDLLTGVDSNNAVLAAGSVDPNWTISTDDGATFVSAKVAFAAQQCCGMESVSASAAWITDPSVTSDSDVTGWGIGNVVRVRRTFDMTGLDASAAQISGVWRVADATAGIFLNGHEIVPGDATFTFGFDSALPAAADGFFLAGLNTLEIRGTSVNSQFDAVWFAGSVTAPSAVPLPPALLMLGSAFGGLMLRLRKEA